MICFFFFETLNSVTASRVSQLWATTVKCLQPESAREPDCSGDEAILGCPCNAMLQQLLASREKQSELHVDINITDPEFRCAAVLYSVFVMVMTNRNRLKLKKSRSFGVFEARFHNKK